MIIASVQLQSVRSVQGAVPTPRPPLSTPPPATQMEMLQLISPGCPGAAAVMSRETGNCVKLVPRPRQEEELTIRITPRWDAGTCGTQLDNGNGIATFICEAFCRDVQTM